MDMGAKLLAVEDEHALRAAVAGNLDAAAPLLQRDRDRLRRMIALRLDLRVQARLDPSDVLQEAQLEALRRLPEYLAKPTMPFFLWLRLITGQRLSQLHRQHLGAQARAASREISLHREPLPEASSIALAQQLLGRMTDPPDHAIRAELKLKLQEAINTLDDMDREIIALRHFEQLSTFEVAAELDISVEAAKKRHIRAIKRLKAVLSDIPGGLELFQP
jgi:RNA polymerase sigma-70 factor (ECF subfamily)